MIYELEGDLLQAPQKIIAHGCNCQGVMGTGVALAIKQAYPKAFHVYAAAVRNKVFRPGACTLVHIDDNRAVAHLATQDYFGRNGTYARPDWIERALRNLVIRLAIEGLTEFASSPLGCGHGGLDWKADVQPIFQRIAEEHFIDIYVYRLPSRFTNPR